MNAAEVEPIVPRPRRPWIVGGHGGHRAERRYTAGAAEEVVHGLVPELVHGQAVRTFHLDLRWMEVVRGYDRPFADADGAVASQAARDLLAGEREADGTRQRWWSLLNQERT